MGNDTTTRRTPSKNTNTKQGAATTLYTSVTVLDPTYADFEPELRRSLPTLKALKAKHPKEYKKLLPLVTGIFQIRTTKVVPLPPIYLEPGKKPKAGRKSPVRTEALRTQAAAAFRSRLSKALSEILTRSVINLRHLDDVELAEGFRPPPHVASRPKGSMGSVWDDVTKRGGMKDGRGYYSDEPAKRTSPDDQFDEEITRDKTGVVTVVYTPRHSNRDGGGQQTQTFARDGTVIPFTERPLDKSLPEYIRNNYHSIPRKTPRPEADHGSSAAWLHAIMTYALFRQQARETLRALEIARGSPLDIEWKPQRDPFRYDAEMQNMFRKEHERHMQAERNKFGLREKKRPTGGKMRRAWVGWTDPPNISVGVQ